MKTKKKKWIILLRESSVSWDIRLCSPLKVNRRFGEHVASIFRVEE
jgi:hypothetical protein